MCERRTPNSAGFWYYDFERPLVLLREKLNDAQLGRIPAIFGENEDTIDLDAVNPTVIKLMAEFLTKAEDISKRLTAEQVATIYKNFGFMLERAWLIKRATDEERQSLERSHGAVRDQTWLNIANRIEGEQYGPPAAQPAQVPKAQPAPTPAPEQQHTWDANPEDVCGSVLLPATQERCPRTIIHEERADTWREGGDRLQPDECRWINDSWQSFNLTDLRRQLAETTENGRNTGCDSTMLRAMEWAAPASSPSVREARADLEKCLESRRMALAAKIKEKEERCPAKVAAEAERKRKRAAEIEAENEACAAKAAARAEMERQIVADNEKCKADVGARKQERVEKAPTRPIAEIEAIPPTFRLPEEVQRMEAFAAAQVAKKMNGRKKPKTDR
jgi:hypothetical protein